MTDTISGTRSSNWTMSTWARWRCAARACSCSASWSRAARWSATSYPDPSRRPGSRWCRSRTAISSSSDLSPDSRASHRLWCRPATCRIWWSASLFDWSRPVAPRLLPVLSYDDGDWKKIDFRYSYVYDDVQFYWNLLDCPPLVMRAVVSWLVLFSLDLTLNTLEPP